MTTGKKTSRTGLCMLYLTTCSSHSQENQVRRMYILGLLTLAELAARTKRTRNSTKMSSALSFSCSQLDEDFRMKFCIKKCSTCCLCLWPQKCEIGRRLFCPQDLSILISSSVVDQSIGCGYLRCNIAARIGAGAQDESCKGTTKNPPMHRMVRAK
jgi:hypothetical protein